MDFNDNYDPFSAHVIPAMINKIHTAKKKSKKSLKLLYWKTSERISLFR